MENNIEEMGAEDADVSHITGPARKGSLTVKAVASGDGLLAIHDRYVFQNIATIWTKPTCC